MECTCICPRPTWRRAWWAATRAGWHECALHFPGPLDVRSWTRRWRSVEDLPRRGTQRGQAVPVAGTVFPACSPRAADLQYAIRGKVSKSANQCIQRTASPNLRRSVTSAQQSLKRYAYHRSRLSVVSATATCRDAEYENTRRGNVESGEKCGKVVPLSSRLAPGGTS